MPITGLDALRKLFDAASATINANAVGLPFDAIAMLIAIGTITTVAPTWLITRVKHGERRRLVVDTSTHPAAGG